MKLGMIMHAGRPTVIAQVDNMSAVAVDFPWMEDLIEAGERGLDTAAQAIENGKAGKAATIDVSEADWMPPNPKPSKILGCAVNNKNLNRMAYRPMTKPMFFIKGRNALTAHNKTIDLLKDHGRCIPEPEPVVVFNKRAKDIRDEDAMDYVFGYTLTNDVTASGVKFGEDSIALSMKEELIGPHHMAWRKRFDDDNFLYFVYHAKSKGADTFASMGPWLTTKDEIKDPNNLRMRGYIDGDCFADDSTSNYFFPIERVISEATKWFTMEAGDCIHTGTASKGTDKFPNGNIGTWLLNYDGKSCEVEIEGLGRMNNIINLEK